MRTKNLGKVLSTNTIDLNTLNNEHVAATVVKYIFSQASKNI